MDVPDICVRLGLVPQGASKQERARALAIARAPVPPGLRAIHPTWIEHALAGLGFSGVGSVRQGKVFDIEIASGDKAKAEADLKAMCDKLLANTVIENYAVEIG